MKGLVLDAGNTRIKLYRWDDRSVAPVGCGETPPLLTQVESWSSSRIQADAQGVAGEIGLRVGREEPGPVVMTSVLPRLEAPLRASLPHLLVVDHRLDLPFALAVDDPAAVGADRLCNMAAAAAAGLKRALVVDVGTAVTFDVLCDGTFIGGLIAPGPGFALEQLARRAARLQDVPLESCPLEAGASTRQAMMAGAWHMGREGIRGCVAGLQKQHGPLTVVLTGGQGQAFQEVDWFWDPHFTLRGAAVLGGLCPFPPEST